MLARYIMELEMFCHMKPAIIKVCKNLIRFHYLWFWLSFGCTIG